MASTLYIKNMVCPRCIAAVKATLSQLQMAASDVQLGVATLTTAPTAEEIAAIKTELLKNGFELVEEPKSILISQIKTIIIDFVHYSTTPLAVNVSTLLSERLNHEYTSLSKLFSTAEGMTIEKYVVKQKIERVKELLCCNQYTLSEIAALLNYSSTAHLSAQFKKETGMTPSLYKSTESPNRQSLDAI